jgi:hypothetical protein
MGAVVNLGWAAVGAVIAAAVVAAAATVVMNILFPGRRRK